MLVVEAHEHGGRARTVERDGFSHNIGPHGLYVAGHLQSVLDRSGLHVAGSRLATGRATLAVRGELHDVDFGPVGLRTTALRPRHWFRPLRQFARLPRLDPAAFVGRTVHEWLGDEPAVVQDVVGTFVRVSTYTQAPDELDAGVVIAQVQQSLRGVRYLDGGWAWLVATLSGRGARSCGTQAVTGVAAQRVVVAGDGDLVVETARGEVRARSVVIAAGGPDVAERLTGTTVAGRDACPPRRSLRPPSTSLDHPHAWSSASTSRCTCSSPHAAHGSPRRAPARPACTMRYLAPGEAPADPDAERAGLRQFAERAGIRADDVLHEWALHRSVVSHGAPSARGGGLAGRPAIDAAPACPGCSSPATGSVHTACSPTPAASSGEDAARHALAIRASIRGRPPCWATPPSTWTARRCSPQSGRDSSASPTACSVVSPT